MGGWGMGGRGGFVMGIKEGTCWDEHWVLYGNQFDNKFHIKKIKKTKELIPILLKLFQNKEKEG